MGKKKITLILLLFSMIFLVFSACTNIKVSKDDNIESDILTFSKLYGYDSYNEKISMSDLASHNLKIDPNEQVWVNVVLGDGIGTDYLNESHSQSFSNYIENEEVSIKKQLILNEQNDVIEKISELGIKYTSSHSFDILYNGFAILTEYKNIEKINGINDVQYAYMSEIYNAPEISESNIDNSLYGDSGIFTNNTGYSGDGMTIAVIDTGLDYNHTAFQNLPKKGEFNRDNIASLLTSTKAYSIMRKKLTVNDVYINDKIPFAFDYADKDTEVNPSQTGVLKYKGFHGTHVAGIAAGKDDVIQGVAPNAQLAIMKVFSDESDGAIFTNVVAAIEDCLVLGIDVANVSLGVPCGYTKDISAAGANTQKIFDMVDKLGIIVCVATGNDDNSSYGADHKHTNLAENPDNGVINSPATYYSAFAVASIVNDGLNHDNNTYNPAKTSSMGALGNLDIGVDIMGVGGNVLSAINAYYSDANETEKHIRLSGTSMATPNVSGVMTIIKQMLKEKYPSKTENDIKAMMYQLLMSTATVINNSEGNPITPRRQGAGIINLNNAINSEAYIKVNGSDKAKLNLGSDINKNGIYTLTFDIVNMSNIQSSYIIDTKTFTETVKEGYIIEKAHVFNDIDVDIYSDNVLISNNTITIDANNSVSVKAVIKLNGDDKAYMDSTFPNGIYVEGFVFLKNSESGCELSLPWISFYGDWNKVPMFDATIYEGNIQTSPNYIAITEYSDILSFMGPSNVYPLGGISYKIASGYDAVNPDINKIAINEKLGIGRIYFSLLRNATDIILRLQDKITGVIYDEGTLGSLIKTVNKNGIIQNNGYLDLGQDGQFNASNYTWANNQEIQFIVSGYLENGYCQELIYPLFIDYEEPTLISAEKEDNGNTLKLNVYDNHYLQAIVIYIKEDGKLINLLDGAIPVNNFIKSSDNIISIDLTSYKNIIEDKDIAIELIDYAGNHSTYGMQSNATPNAENVISDNFDYKLNFSSGYDISTIMVEQENDIVPMSEEYEKVGDFYINGTTLVGYAGQGGDIIVPQGITEIGPKAFYLNDKITSVILPEGVTIIKNSAFEKCCKMTKIVLPESLKELGERSFAGCYALADFNLENTHVEVYGKYCILGNNAIKELTIPKTDNPIKINYSFNMMLALTKLTVLADIEYTDSSFFILPELKQVDFYGETMIGVRKKANGSFQVCDKLEVINFHNKAAVGYEYKTSSGTVVSSNTLIALQNLREVNFYGDTEFIYGRSFNNCPNLEKVSFGGKIGLIGHDTFAVSSKLQNGFDIMNGNNAYIKDEYGIVYNTEKTEMFRPSEMEIEGVYKIPENLEVLPERAFSHGDMIIFAVVPQYELNEDGYYYYRVTSSATNYYCNREKMTGVILHDKITALPEKCFADNVNLTFDYSNITEFGNASLYNTGFESLTLKDNVKKIGKQVWAYSSKLKELSYPKEAEYTSYEYMFAGLNIKELILPDWMPCGKFMFKENNAEKIIFTNPELKVLENFAFYLCKNLKYVEGIDKVQKLTGWTFDSCTSLVEIDMPSLTYIGSAAFQNCSSLERVNYSKNLTYLGSGCFSNCVSLKSIYIPSAIKSINMARQFYNSYAFEEFIVEENHPTYVTIDGALYLKDLSELIAYPVCSKNTEHTIPASISGISDGKFANAKSLCSINYEGQNLSLGMAAFKNCENLANIDLSKIVSIGTEAFRNTAIENINIHNDIKLVGGYAFADNENLKSIYISENSPEFDYASVFSGCYNIENIEIAKECTNFVTENGILMNGRKTIVYKGFTKDENLIIPEGIIKISEKAFYGNESIKTIVFPSSLLSIGHQAFYGCTKLSELTFKSDVAPRLEGFRLDTEKYPYSNFIDAFKVSQQINVYVNNNSTYISYIWRNYFKIIYININGEYIEYKK